MKVNIDKKGYFFEIGDSKNMQYVLDKLPKRLCNKEADEIIKRKISVENISARIESFFLKIRTVSAMARLILELKDKFTEYDLVIGDDVSGRLLTLCLKEIINHSRKKIKLDKVKVKFIAGGRGKNNREDFIYSFLKKISKDTRRVLFVTEYIFEGNNIIWITELFKKANIDYDLAVVSLNWDNFVSNYLKDDKATQNKKDRLLSNIYYGSFACEGMDFYNSEGTLSGVNKDFFSLSAHSIRSKAIYPDKLKARQDMKFLAEEFIKLID